MVIRKRDRAGDRPARGLERIDEAFGIRDAGNREHLPEPVVACPERGARLLHGRGPSRRVLPSDRNRGAE